MASKLNDAKKHYIAPSFKELDANAARTELEATGMPEDPSAEKMLSAIDEKLKEKTKKPPLGESRTLLAPVTRVRKA